MTHEQSLLTLALFLSFCGSLFSAEALPNRDALKKAYDAGNYKDAFEGYRRLALDPQDDPLQVGEDLKLATASLSALGRPGEIDELRDAVIQAHEKNWRLLGAAAETFFYGNHAGSLVGGIFYRGNQRGGGQWVSSIERDRVRALQLMVQGLEGALADPNKDEASYFFFKFAEMLYRGRGETWRLQYLTDLKELPDYSPNFYYDQATRGAPVDAENRPIFYQVPASFAAAENDGQRWRWGLAQAVKIAPGRLNQMRLAYAESLEQQFGVETLAPDAWLFMRGGPSGDGQPEPSSIYDLHSLRDNETIACLATGIQRFELPDEFNPIKIYEQIVAEPKTGFAVEALPKLAQIFANRRQFPRAADYWRQLIKEFGPGEKAWRQQKLDEIVGNWGRFESVVTQPAGKGATVDFAFRNGRKVSFEARTILVEKLLADMKTYVKSNPKGGLNWQKYNLADIGHRLVTQGEDKYLGDKIAAWDLELDPPQEHFDRRITVATPLQQAGAYLLTAKMADGNTCQIVVWLADTVILKKPLEDKTFYYVADAVTGKPIPHANVEFFGYQQTQAADLTPKVNTLDFAQFTDNSGMVQPGVKQQPANYQWVITARTREGRSSRLAFLGITNVWLGQQYDHVYNQTKVFTITDRPVYRPKQKVQFKFWVRHAKYDQEDGSDFADQEFAVELQNPRGEKRSLGNFKADAYGGFSGELELPDDAVLGMYQLFVPGKGGGSFRVEEYKKPEFEVVVDAPDRPVMLGEKITATVRAKYYFGAPVVTAKVKYKVMRSNYGGQWFPVAPWDWFYGPGYWWFGYDAPWYRGWSHWGCVAPIPWWWGGAQQPPELIADREVEIGPDGTIKIEIDTALAKEIHPDQDHRYEITAEVVDESRRTIVGTGSVLVARKPFKVFAWLDRGYYRAGDVIQANFKAQTVDQKPVAGTGTLKLLSIRYDQDKQPVEKTVEEWALDTNAEGQAQQQIKAAEPGQYRLSYSVTDTEQHTIEGGYLFTIVGPDFNGTDFRFNDVELIPDRREYQPGDKVQLQVNVNRPNSVVLLFVRPAEGVYLPPQMLKLDGKSTIVPIDITKKDMPNFFVEAVTISAGRVFSTTKEIVVPPEKRVLNLEILPSAATYKPGQKAKVKLKLTDYFGKPFVGTTVTTVYDKSVEYISGGSNVPQIKAFFWKWRRTHHPQNETNLDRGGYNLALPNSPAMQNLGMFGGTRKVSNDSFDFDEPTDGIAGGKRLRFGKARLGVQAAEGPMLERFAAAIAPASEAKSEAYYDSNGAGPEASLATPTLRTNFADTALWVAALTTDSGGMAEIELDMPDSLTTWKIRTWGMGQGTRVGQGEAEVITRKDLIVRLQSPRFFVETDEVVLSANVHSYLDKPKNVQVVLDLPGQELTLLDSARRTVQIAPGGEHRVDWRVKVAHAGEAVIRMQALTDEESDAMEMRFPVYVHGMLKTESWSGAIRPEDTAGKVTFRVPEKRRAEQSRLEVHYSPSLAAALVDALPYLASYPYQSSDQTLDRFLPAVITQKILLDMNLDLKAIEQKHANLNAQEIGDDAERPAQWKRHPDHNPVFDEAEVREMVQRGLRLLGEMQLDDGGWGWFSGWGETSSAHNTAYVVHGLQQAAANDVALVPGVLEKGVAWLSNYQDQQVKLLQNAPSQTIPWKGRADELDAFVFMVLVDAGMTNDAMRDFLYRDRTAIAVYAKAMFGLALERLVAKNPAEREKLDMILKNISQYVVQDAENQTAYLKLPNENYWWYWYGNDVEANSYYLKLLVRTDPKNPVAAGLVKYLLNNRKHATWWNSTRDTAVAIESLADYLKASGEARPDLTIEVWLDGQKRKEVTVTPETLLTFDNKLVLEGDALSGGDHTLEIRKRGTGPLYFNVYATNFTLEDFITPAGLEIKVARRYYKLTPQDKTIKAAGSRGQAVDQRVAKFSREPLDNLATLTSGDLVEIEFEIDSKNDYEYLMLEDMKPAGFEPVEVRSGYNSNDLGAYLELRDNRVTFFLRRLARGKHGLSYRMRAETPGKFSALPTQALGVYAPELRANSAEIKLNVVDAARSGSGE